MQPYVEAFFDRDTETVSYVAFDAVGGHALVVDPVLDYDPRSGRTRTVGADKMIAFIKSNALTVVWILETHAHADHLSSSGYIKQQVGGQTAIGENIRVVQNAFKNVFNLGSDFRPDGSQFDHLFTDGEVFRIGRLEGRALFVPGHTPADMAYLIGDVAFIGDTLFMPDVGSARCDFPGGCARSLYKSVCRLLALPDATRMFVCHDYPPPGREPCWETTVREQRTGNIHMRDGVTEEAFVKMRTARDATLDMPRLILPAIQVNIRGGELPPIEENGIRYLKIPLNGM